MSVAAIHGVIVPLLTPFNDDLTIATDLYVSHARWLFAQGCAGIAPFGTTGEALSVGIDERIAAIQDLVDKRCPAGQGQWAGQGPEGVLEVQGDPDAALTPTQKLHLYRIVNELLNNAASHANCSQLRVALTSRPPASCRWLAKTTVRPGTEVNRFSGLWLCVGP